MKKIFVSLFLVLSLFLSSCGGEIYGHCELRLPLDESYSSIDQDGFDKTFSNGRYVIAILRISFVAGFEQGIPETMSAREFCYFWMKKLDRDLEIHSDSITPYYIYFEDSHFYMNAFYRSPDAYFVVLLSTTEGQYPDCLDNFIDIIDGAKFEY